jgi:hypothetical protein
MQEAAGFHTGHQLRQLFATIICYNDDVLANDLFEAHFPALSDDCARAVGRSGPGTVVTDANVRDLCLLELDKAIGRVNATKSLADFGLPLSSADAAERLQPGE